MELLSLIDQSLMAIHLHAENSEEAIRKLGTLLIEQGNVTEDYVEEVIKREKEFPTGLPTSGIKVALPHTGAKHVLHSAMAVGVLEKPVRFQLMGNQNTSTEVEVVFLLAIHEETGQVIALQQLVQLLQNDEALQRIAASTTVDQLYDAVLDGIREIQLLRDDHG